MRHAPGVSLFGAILATLLVLSPGGARAALTIPQATITLDGSTADWTGIAALVTGGEGDSLPGPGGTPMAGTDLKALYAARDSSYLYLRLDLWDAFNTGFGNGPIPYHGSYRVHVLSDSPSYPQLDIGVAFGVFAGQPFPGTWNVGYNGSNGSAPPDFTGPTFVAVSGGVMELRVPLASLGNPTRFDRIWAATTDCCARGTGLGVLDNAGAGAGAGDVAAPTVPGTPALSAPSTSRVDVQWPGSTDNVAVFAYVLARDGAVIGVLANSSVNSWQDDTVQPGATYRYAVLACDMAGNCSAYSASAAITPSAPATGRPTDLDGNGRSDILYRNFTTGQVYRFLMNGLAIAGESIAYVEPDTAWKIVVEGDFNGDGVTDLLWRNDSTGAVYLMPFGRNGLPAGGSVVYTEANPAWKVVHAPDLDGNGTADLLWWNSSTGQVYAMLVNLGAIGTQGLVYTEPNTAWKIVAVGDFSGSGRKNQLLWRNSTTGQVYLMTVSVSGGVFSQTGQMIYEEPNTAWKVIGAGDFNADVRTDILWRNDATGQVHLMLMNGPAIASQGLVYAEPDTAWKIVAQGDYDGNWKADLLWRNESTGQVYMMLMDGLSIASQGTVYSEPDTAWRVLGPWEYGQAAGILGADAGPGKSMPSTLTGEPLERGMIGGWPVNPSPGLAGRRIP